MGQSSQLAAGRVMASSKGAPEGPIRFHTVSQELLSLKACMGGLHGAVAECQQSDHHFPLEPRRGPQAPQLVQSHFIIRLKLYQGLPARFEEVVSHTEFPN